MVSVVMGLPYPYGVYLKKGLLLLLLTVSPQLWAMRKRRERYREICRWRAPGAWW
jgi:hypothetical protein